jgi:hypothetical protein
MKKYIIIVFVALSFLYSCGFDDIDAEYGTTVVLFWNQEYNRNIVVGEGLKLKAGVVLGGLLTNNEDRVVQYTLDGSLVTDDSKTILPASYYTLGHASNIVIHRGEFIGYLDIVIDSVAFLSDPKSLTGEYVLPFRITGSNDIDSINLSKDHMVVSISYWAKQHGNYYYSGTAVRKQDGAVVQTIEYKDNPSLANSIRKLETVGPNTLKVIADPSATSADPAKNKYSFYVSVASLGGGEVTIGADPASSIAVSPMGSSSYDHTSKTFTLNYTYTDGNQQVEISEQMVFRNRIRDVQADGQGVNEYRGF